MTQQYFTESEWSTLMQAPWQAIAALTLADKTDPVSFLKEIRVGMEIMLAEQQREDITNDLVKSLVASLNQADTKRSLEGEALLLQKQTELLLYLQNLNSASEGRQQSLNYFNEVAKILAAKVTSMQASEFKSWILSIARRVAEAVRERGFFGVGISNEEMSMLKKLEETLTIKV
ncbi:hypothetical protein ACE1B6_16660 [Aerosakkonemataceae cyanobacterium BLCC-F154]|uniref:Uncharacterized protein n=1 Tax=Floridaenema fluviatile BLCC-F154 TaxID=3153640 RepID=A0ABV4YFJ8_9CYAN